MIQQFSSLNFGLGETADMIRASVNACAHFIGATVSAAITFDFFGTVRIE